MTDQPTPLDGAKAWVTSNHRLVFKAEIANEAQGGVSPSTLSSMIDSLSQGSEVLCKGWKMSDFVALLMIVDLVGTGTELADLLD